MRFSLYMRDLLEELQRRKDAKEDPCESCHGTDLYLGRVCTDCLGQGIRLTRKEYDTILAVARAVDDRILEQAFLD